MRKGALFVLEQGADKTLISHYYNFAIQGRIDSDCVDFVQSVFNLCEEDPEQITDMASLEFQFGKSRATIINRCKSLIDAGLVLKESIKLPRKHPQTRFTILAAKNICIPQTNPDRVINLPVLSKYAHTVSAESPHLPSVPENEFAQSLALSKAMNITGDLFKHLSIKGEWFSIFTLAAALPSGKTGKLLESSYTCPIAIGNEIVQLEVRPTQGTKVASVLDLRILITIITIVSKRLMHGHPAMNPFVLDFNEICEVIENAYRNKNKRSTDTKKKGRNTKTGSFKQYILSALERWESTGFKIISASKGFIDKFDGRIELKQAFRLIYKTKVLSFVGSKGKTPGKIAIYLDDEFLARIADKDSRYVLTLHDDVLAEGNPFAVRFNIWCRRAVKHIHKPRSWSVKHLHREVEPLRKFKSFNPDLKAFYQSHFDEAKGYANYLGYNFKVNEDLTSYLIWADPADRLVGTNSHFAYLQKKTKLVNG